jgi:hypothetical protein
MTHAPCLGAAATTAAVNAWIALVIAFYLGLLSFAAVRTARFDCGDRQAYATTDSGELVTTDRGQLVTVGRRSCRLIIRL